MRGAIRAEGLHPPRIVQAFAGRGGVEDGLHHLLRYVANLLVERVSMQRIRRATVVQNLLDLSRVPLHIATKGGMTLKAAVLHHAQHLELDVHIVLLQTFQQKILQLLHRTR